MKKTIILMLAVISAGVVFAQNPPRWFEEQSRETNFPSSVFYTGFATGSLRSGETKEKVMERMRKEAQAYCLEAIRVNVNSTVSDYSKSIKQLTTNAEIQEKIEAIFVSSIKTEATAEITGLKVETYSANDGLVYAFAYVNKYELIGYYNASLSMNLQQLEAVLNTAKQFENNSEKSKAKKQYEEAIPILVKVEQAQDMLIAIDPNASIQRDKSAKYRSEIIQALARLEQGIYIFVKCKEVVDNKEVVYIANKLPGLLTEKGCGCNFTEDEQQADYQIIIDANVLRCNDAGNGTVFCWASAIVSVCNAKTKKTLKPQIDEAKGGWTNNNTKKAGEEAFDVLVKRIAEKVVPMIKD